jgi:hypothetical protein
MLDLRHFNTPAEHAVPALTPHSFAEIFPLMSGAELEALADDIAVHGIREPVVINTQDEILDGRNRFKGWLMRGVGRVPLRTRLFGSLPSDGTDELAFVISANLHRRHLNESQRAMVASRLATLPAHRPPGTAQTCALPQEQAAETLNVSRRLVQEARRLQTQGTPELIAAVDSGLMTVTAAAAISARSTEEQLGRVDRERRKADGTHRPGDDWYRTPDETTDAVLNKVALKGAVWEPACGDGAVSKRLLARGYDVVSTDLNDHGYGTTGIDFLATTTLPDGVESVMTNPPYGLVPDDPSKDLATEFVAHALDLGARQVLVLCRLQFLEGSYRQDRLYSHEHLEAVYVFVSRQTLWRGDDVYAEDAGGMTAYAWFLFDRDHSGPWAGYWLGAPD